jgi:4-diphosphocytidyl-2-C-methyl-D-erythritol kinase
MIRATAYAKINFGLRVRALREDGFHPLSGIFQSIDLRDELALESHAIDEIRAPGGEQVPDGRDNLAFRAVAAVRRRAESSQPFRLTLAKKIPVAAGLGGGSADAAAGLALAGRVFGVGDRVLAELAPSLGSDVPFCFRGGTARVGGRGEEIDPLPALTGFALGVVVPPFELSTPGVFRRWDELEQPRGLRIDAGALPPQLRSEEYLSNDLYPAAVSLVPAIDEWRQELENVWSRPVMLSGSGPALYGFFLDVGEAEDAISAIPPGARFAEACGLTARGWAIAEDEPA